VAQYQPGLIKTSLDVINQSNENVEYLKQYFWPATVVVGFEQQKKIRRKKIQLSRPVSSKDNHPGCIPTWQGHTTRAHSRGKRSIHQSYSHDQTP
jgi:hypothetical protein